MITSAYVGNLRAFLMSPSYLAPMATASDVIGSGLPWRVTIYQSPDERYWTEAGKEDVRRMWEDKTEAERYSPDVYEEVVSERKVSRDIEK